VCCKGRGTDQDREAARPGSAPEARGEPGVRRQQAEATSQEHNLRKKNAWEPKNKLLNLSETNYCLQWKNKSIFAFNKRFFFSLGKYSVGLVPLSNPTWSFPSSYFIHFPEGMPEHRVVLGSLIHTACTPSAGVTQNTPAFRSHP
jgi:hypothetical protein